MQALARQGLLKGAGACKLEFCKHCIIRKKTKVKFGTATHCTKGLLDYVHTDVWGPIKTASIGGNHYFVSFIDDYSRRCWVYTMKHKGECPRIICEVEEAFGEKYGKENQGPPFR